MTLLEQCRKNITSNRNDESDVLEKVLKIASENVGSFNIEIEPDYRLINKTNDVIIKLIKYENHNRIVDEYVVENCLYDHYVLESLLKNIKLKNSLLVERTGNHLLFHQIKKTEIKKTRKKAKQIQEILNDTLTKIGHKFLRYDFKHSTDNSNKLTTFENFVSIEINTNLENVNVFWLNDLLEKYYTKEGFYINSCQIHFRKEPQK